MFQNYFKVAFRNMMKKKAFTSLNLIGLSVGISSVILVAIYLQHELTYDQSHPESDRIYRLVNDYRDQTYTCMQFNDYDASNYEAQLRLVNHLQQYSDVEEACHFVTSTSPIGPDGKTYVQVGNRQYTMEKLLYTNTGMEFQQLFPQTYLEGSPEFSYASFQRVVLSESSTELLYGANWRSQEIVGSILTVGERDFVLGGVIKDVPGNVHYDFNMIVYQEEIPSWGAYTYFKHRPSATADQVLARLNAEVDLFYPGYTEDVLSKGIRMVPLEKVHFTSGMLYEIKPIANTTYLLTFGIVGLVILLIIWTNYANLSTAIYAGRQREVGVRKLMGARSRDVAFQILTEAVMLTVFCFPFALGLTFLMLPEFNELMGVVIAKGVLAHPMMLALFLLIVLLTGLISGFYPALVFSKKSLISLFEGKLNLVKSRRVWNLRNGILTIQFFLLIGLTSIAFIIKGQMDFIQNREMGFQKEGVLFFDVDGKASYDQLKMRLEQIPGIKEIGSGLIPGREMYNQLTYKMEGTVGSLSDGTHIHTSLGALQVLGISSEAFRLLNFQDSVLIINETAAKKLAASQGVAPGDLIGETLVTEPEWENERFGYGQHFSIAGIIEDFDYFSLRHESQPLILEVHREPNWVYNVLVKAETENWFETVSKIEAAYLDVEKRLPFDATFLDDHLNQLYAKEKSAGVLASTLVSVCVLLAVMGLVGVVGFITVSRQKEIAVRRVFGASVKDILLALNKQYVMLMGIGTLLAVPVSIYLGNLWLNSFAYRITPDFSVVLLAGLMNLLLVLTVVVLQSLRSARRNPSVILRNE